MEPYQDSTILPLPTGDAGVALTLSHLRQFVTQAQTSELAHAAVQDALALTPEKSPQAEAAALLAWVRARYRYTLDPVEVELVRDPRYLLRQIQTQGMFYGDCDDASVLVAALLETAGYPTRFVVQGDTGDSFAHVLVEVDLDGAWTAVDPTNRSAALGWAPPGPGREARERRLSMLGQYDAATEAAIAASLTGEMGTGGFTDQGLPETSTTPAPAAGAAGSSVSDFFTSLFSPSTVQQALAVAERVGLYKPIIGYNADGSPIYGATIPATGTAAAFTSLTATLGGLPTWLWLVGGVGVLLVMRGGRRRR